MVVFKSVVVLFLVLLLVQECKFWRRRRRRRSPPPCGARDCTVTAWSNWGACTHQCGNSGISTRTRSRRTHESCGGRCPYQLRETRACNRHCPNGGTPLSGRCSCRPGLTGTCCLQDVNECLQNPCQHFCTNTFGSYTCKCKPCYTKLNTRCELRQCAINDKCYTYNTVNPSNPCQKCSSSNKLAWTNDNSLRCNDGKVCTKLDRCDNGRCVGTPFSCLSCQECYNDVCRVKAGYCLINNKCFTHGNLRPSYPCQQCDSNNKFQWTNNNNLRCSDNNARTRNDRCVNGACLGTPYNCLPCEQHDGSGCPLKSGHCIITHQSSRTCFANHQLKPGNPCQWCNPRSSTSSWSNRNGVSCNDGNACSRGDTCNGGQCRATPFSCNSLCQVCNGNSCSLKSGFGYANGKCTCKIGGRDYNHQTVNPSNQCQWCDLYDASARTKGEWTNRPTVPCDDGNKCTKKDTCKTGRCTGEPYSCQASYPSSSCIQRSVCVGDGTCRDVFKARGTICRAAVDNCDQPERCNGNLGGCPAAVTDRISLTTGSLQLTSQLYASAVSYQYITNTLYLKIAGFSASCGSLTLKWYLLDGAASCSVSSSTKGTLPSTSSKQPLTGLHLQDNKSYKVSIQALDMRGRASPPICSGVVTVDTTKPQGGWIRDGSGVDLAYQSTKLIQANWGGVNTRNGVARYEWTVMYKAFGSSQTSQVLPFTNVSLNTRASRTFSAVQDGGKITVTVRAYTKAGLYSDLSSNGVIVDTSAPVVGKIYDGNVAGLDVKFAKWTNTFSANWERFTDSHSPISRYQWAVKRHNAGLITSFKSVALNRFPTATGLNLVSGEKYCAVVKGYNEAGLFSQAVSDCVLIDHNPPLAGTVNDGTGSDVDYQSVNDKMSSNWLAFSDGNKGSGIVEYRYKIVNSRKNDVVGWTSVGNATTLTRTGLSLTNGEKYYVIIRAVDAVGLFTDVSSDGVTADTTRPVFTGTVNVTGEPGTINGSSSIFVASVSSLRVQWPGFSDGHSGLDYYMWAVIPWARAATNSDFTRVPGVNLATSATISVSLTEGAAYFVIIRAINKARLYKDASSVLIIPDASPPQKGSVFDGATPLVDVQYQTVLNSVSASWTKFIDPHTAIKEYQYAVGSCAPGNYHVTKNRFYSVTPPTATSFTLEKVNLVNGQKYCVKIKAKNMAGLSTSEVSSNGFTVDVTPPDVTNAQVRDGVTGTDIDYQANTTDLSAEWEGINDSQSGIRFYEYGVSRNRDGPPDTLGFQRVGLKTRLTVSDLALREEVYYIIICAVNKAGLRKCSSSDGVLIDPTPPSKGVVHDGTLEPDLKYQSHTGRIAANWEGIWDLQSHMVKFEWAVGTSASDKISVQPFTDVGLSTHVKSKNLLALKSGETYYVFLRATNQAGLVSELASDGVTVDSSPPIPSQIFPGFSSNSNWRYSPLTKAFHSSSLGELAAHWNHFAELESELWYYKWAIGTSRCGTQIQPLINIGQINRGNTTSSGLTVIAGIKYYVTVVARNRAGLLSRACSEAFVFDHSAPQAGKVYIGRDPDERLRYISSSSCVISWNGFRDRESEIAQCQIVLKREDGVIVYNFTKETAEGNAMVSKASLLVPGFKYHASVTCSNNAGLQSSASAPDFVIDNTPPRLEGSVTVGVSRDQYRQYQASTNEITATWPPFVDDESPVVRYEIQIGTAPLSGDILQYYDLKGATQYTAKHLKLRHKQTYYVSIRAFNAAGMNATVGASGLTIDVTPPLPSRVKLSNGRSIGNDVSFLSSSRPLLAHWEEIKDRESGIANSKYCLGSQPLGCQMKDLTDVSKNTSFTCNGCGLRNGETLYVTVHVTNGAGLSTTSNSKGILLDDSPPTVGDVTDGSDISGRDVETALKEWNVSISWTGAEDRQSGVKDCIWSIESSQNITLFTLPFTNQIIYGKSKTYHALKKYKELRFVKDEIYSNVIRCSNGAGLQSTTRSNGFQVVPVWPVMGAVRDGLSPGTDIAYSTSSKVVTANWDAFVANRKDPVVNYAWAVGTDAGLDDVLAFTNIGLVTKIQTTLAPDEPDLEVLKQGTQYFVTVRAFSLSGLSNVGSSNGFYVDTTAPESAAVDVTHRVVEQESKLIALHVSWNGVRDLESGIRKSEYCIGTVQQSCLNTLISAGNVTSATIHSFKPILDVNYYVIILVHNWAGLTTTLTSRKLSFDITPPSPGAIIDGYSNDIDYTNSTDSIAVQWSAFEDSESGVKKCQWSLTQKTVSHNGTYFGNETELFQQNVQNSGQASRTGLSLIPGAKYVSAITCENSDGFSVTASSDGVIVDVTPPINGRVSDGSILAKDVNYQSSTTQVQASWEPFFDLESGIMGYRWSLGTAASSDDVIGFVDVGKKTFGSKGNVTLIPGVRYYVTVEATSGSNMTTEAFSDGFTVDITPPELSQLASNNSNWLKADEKLSATWTSRDAESGITKTDYCVGSTPDGCQIKHMTNLPFNAGRVTCHDCSLNPYTTYYITVRVWNTAGLFTIGTTNGTRFDDTAPIPGKIHVKKTIVSCIHNCTLSGNITGFADEESGIKSYSFAVRNSTHYQTGFANVDLSTGSILVRGLTFTHACSYFLEVECENNAGMVSRRVQSSQILVDATPPTKGSVIVSEHRTHDVFGIHSGCHLYNKTIRIHWSRFNDEESGINTFRVGIGKQPFADDVRPLTEVGITTNATLNLIDVSSSLDLGDVVYVTVQAENGAGLFERASSPPTRLVPAYNEAYMKEGDFYCINLF